MALQAVSRTKKGPKTEPVGGKGITAEMKLDGLIKPEATTVDKFQSQPTPMETIISEWSAKQQGEARAKVEKSLTGQLKLEEHINDDGEIDAAEAQELKEYFPGELIEAIADGRQFTKFLADKIPDLSKSLGIPQSELMDLKYILADGIVTDKESKAMIAKIMNDYKAELGRIWLMAGKANEVVEDQAKARMELINRVLKKRIPDLTKKFEQILQEISKEGISPTNFRSPAREMVRIITAWELKRGEILDTWPKKFKPQNE